MEENQNFQPEVEQPQPVNKLNSAAANGLKLALISIGFTLIASFIPKSSTGVMFTFLLSILNSFQGVLKIRAATAVHDLILVEVDGECQFVVGIDICLSLGFSSDSLSG